jgi:hypothetical protein
MDAEKLFMSLILIILFFPFCTSLDTLTPDQSIKDGQSLISKENNFALGFFSPGNSSNRYLGIWYVKVTQHTVVWVANRNDPINDTSGVLSINQFGNLVLHDGYNHLVWSTNVSVQGTIISPVAQLQDSGNLVLVQDNINEKMLWQSFDHPTDTLLPKMKLGLNRKTGLDRFLTSWKSQDDPGSGDCLYKMNPSGDPQVFLYKGSTLNFRSSPWPWQLSAATVSSGNKFNLVNNEDEVSFDFFLDDTSIISRLVVNNSGLLSQFMWNDGDLHWKELWSVPKYQCHKYGHCGAYGICSLESPEQPNRFECTCLPGYEPKSPRNWYLREGSEGCVRKQSGMSMCGNGEGFVKVDHSKVPDSSNATWMNMSSSECEQACLSNCNCTAFFSMNIDGKGTGCLAWYGELMDISVSSDEEWATNVRVDANELGSLLCLLSLFVNFHFSLFQFLDSTGLDLVCFYLICGCCCFFFLFLPFLQLLIQGSPKVFLEKRGSWLLLYYLLLCHCFWHP